MSGPPPAGPGPSDRPPGEPTGPPERTHPGRGLAIVIVAVVVGILVLPSATRSPLSASAVSAAASATTTPGQSTPPAHGHHPTTTTSTTVPPSTIHVLVANATTVNGVAGSVTTFLGSKGFATLTATNALVKVTSSEIFAVGGATAAAQSVAAALALPATSIEPAASAAPVATTTGANVVVVVGPDLATRFTPGATTTAPAG